MFPWGSCFGICVLSGFRFCRIAHFSRGFRAVSFSYSVLPGEKTSLWRVGYCRAGVLSKGKLRLPPGCLAARFIPISVCFLGVGSVLITGCIRSYEW